MDPKSYVCEPKFNAVLGMDTNSVKRTRVALAEMPTLMMDMIESILSADLEIEVVGRMAPGADLPNSVRCNEADVLIIGPISHTLTETTLLKAFSCSPKKIVSIAETVKTGMIWVMRPDGTPISELSAEALIGAAKSTGHTC